MLKTSVTVLMLSLLLLFTGCSAGNTQDETGIVITDIMSGIGSAGENTNDFETQSFKFTITMKNNEAADIGIVSVRPVLSEKLLERVPNKDTTINVNKVIAKGTSLSVSGEIIFDARGLTKEQIAGIKPFVQEVRLIEERTIEKSF